MHIIHSRALVERGEARERLVREYRYGTVRWRTPLGEKVDDEEAEQYEAEYREARDKHAG